jgi:hypothetical protein
VEDVKFTVQVEVTVTGEDIDNIVTTAFEGGITYWCTRGAEVVKQPEDKESWDGWASTAISRGGEVKLFDDEAGEEFVLTKDKVINGVKMFLECKKHDPQYNAGVLEGGRLDCGNIDADVADIIIQYGLFEELVYG